jgi:hypothetical protein
MKSALKMMKADKKMGVHRDSAMYMGHSPMEMGHESPAKNMNKGYGQEVPSPMKRESAELKDMPIVDIEKGKGKGDYSTNPDKNPMAGKRSMKDKMDNFGKGNKKPDTEKTYGSPAKAAKPDYIDIDKDGNTTESMKDAAKSKGSPAKKQGYNDRLDESLAKDGKESSKKQSLKDRRDESKGMEKSKGKGAYSSDSAMSRKSSPANISEKAAKRKAGKGKGFVNKVYGGKDNGKAKTYTKLTRQGRKDLKETGKVSSKEIKKTVKIK